MNPEYDISSRISRQETEDMQRGRRIGYVQGFLNQFGVNENPISIPKEARHLIELAHMNVRLMTNNYLPLDRAYWLIIQIHIGGVPKRKTQFETLKALGLLRKVII